MIIESMQAQHWPAVRAIYQAGIDSGHATFESRAPDSFEQWLAAHVPELCLLGIEGSAPAGWAASGSVSSRCVYAGVGKSACMWRRHASGAASDAGCSAR